MHEDVSEIVHDEKCIICSILFEVETNPCLLVIAGHGNCNTFFADYIFSWDSYH